jgi:hypothetical protein
LVCQNFEKKSPFDTWRCCLIFSDGILNKGLWNNLFIRFSHFAIKNRLIVHSIAKFSLILLLKFSFTSHFKISSKWPPAVINEFKEERPVEFLGLIGKKFKLIRLHWWRLRLLITKELIEIWDSLYMMIFILCYLLEVSFTLTFGQINNVMVIACI